MGVETNRELLTVSHLSVTLGGREILRDISFSVCEGHWLMVVGPNGAGKTTLVNALTQGIPYSGMAAFEGRDLKKMKPLEIASKIAVLRQRHQAGYAFTVEEIVRLGRYRQRSGLFRSAAGKEGDDRAVEKALQETGLLPLRGQSILKLSGGELQRTFLAQTFCQDPALLILDEPTNHLDLLYQKQIFALLADWLKVPGRAVCSIVHDLSLAKAYGSKALLIDQGRQAAFGPAGEVLTEKELNPVYGMEVGQWMRHMLKMWI